MTPDPRPAIVPAEPLPRGLVSVVVLCCGQLEHSRLCALSVLRASRPPYEIVVVDAGSLDGTADYWAGVRAAAEARVEVVRSPAEAELAEALRAGLERTQSEYVVLLNNDTVVPDGWLGQLTALAGTDPALGMVAPMTTFGPGPQVVWPVPYRLGAGTRQPGEWDGVLADIGAVNRFAAEWRDQHRGKWFEADRLGGGCVLVRRAALDRIGPPPGAPLEFFDAEALAQRVRGAGFRLACCRDLFVHSFGARGFATEPPR